MHYKSRQSLILWKMTRKFLDNYVTHNTIRLNEMNSSIFREIVTLQNLNNRISCTKKCCYAFKYRILRNFKNYSQCTYISDYIFMPKFSRIIFAQTIRRQCWLRQHIWRNILLFVNGIVQPPIFVYERK